MAQGELDDQERRIVEEACRAGDSRACVQWFAFAEDPKEVEAPACAASRRASCDATAFCLDGHYDVCGSNSDPVATALTALGPHSKTNPALYQVQVEVDDLAAHCDNGSAAACFLMGLNATADIDPFENGTVPVRSLEVSMGTACNMGANIACYVFALRLLDRDFSGERDTVRARELLDLGCQRGHAESCQLLVSEVLDIRADFDSAIEASRRASITWGVAYWMFVQPLEAYQLGAVPWPVMDSISLRAEEQGCLDANALRQCEWAADARLRLHHGQVGPLWVRTASVAGRACRAGRPAACRTLMRLADFAADFGMTPRAELEKSICSQLPAACSTE